ncbi:MAG: long-chain fatty acid--CoA ligase [Clostridiales bacterium]|nr:long-chain fatty acid--CoA ligase [Clostridiales bacterium]
MEDMGKEEYEELKRKDMEKAEAFAKEIRDSKDPMYRYKDSRPVMDIKHMIESSVELYGKRPAFHVKRVPLGEYEPVTYEQMLLDMNGLGTALITGGLKGKRIGVIGENSYMWAITYLAVVGGTGVVVPLDKELPEKDLKGIVKEAELSCVAFDKKFEKLFKEVKADPENELEVLIGLEAGESNEEVFSWKDFVEKGKKAVAEGNRDFIDAQINSQEMSILLFTSGTTGTSKAVMLSHENICVDLMSLPTLLVVHPEDIFFSMLPVHHTYECTAGFLMPLYKGASIAYCEGLKYIVKNLSEAKPTMFLTVPLVIENMHKKIWQNARKSGKADTLRKMMNLNRKLKKVGINISGIYNKQIMALFGGRLRMLISGGAAILPSILDDVNDWGVTALQGYGLTECAPMCALNPDKNAKSDSLGYIPPGMEFKVYEADPETGIGELCVKGGNVMLGYYNNPEATAQVIRDGWFNTGDLGYVDKEGYIYLTGRKKNVIITANGKNIYPEELEFMLSEIPLISESMVWGFNEQGHDTSIVATVRVDEEELSELTGGKTLSDITDKEILEMLWKEVDVRNEELPVWKKVKKLIIKRDEFDKTTGKKIKRYVEGNKG